MHRLRINRCRKLAGIYDLRLQPCLCDGLTEAVTGVFGHKQAQFGPLGVQQRIAHRMNAKEPNGLGGSLAFFTFFLNNPCGFFHLSSDPGR